MDVFQYITLISTMLGGFVFMYKEMKAIQKDLQDDIKTQSARSDQLYKMFIDLLKDGRKK